MNRSVLSFASNEVEMRTKLLLLRLVGIGLVCALLDQLGVLLDLLCRLLHRFLGLIHFLLFHGRDGSRGGGGLDAAGGKGGGGEYGKQLFHRWLLEKHGNSKDRPSFRTPG